MHIIIYIYIQTVCLSREADAGRGSLPCGMLEGGGSFAQGCSQKCTTSKGI